MTQAVSVRATHSFPEVLLRNNARAGIRFIDQSPILVAWMLDLWHNASEDFSYGDALIVAVVLGLDEIDLQVVFCERPD